MSSKKDAERTEAELLAHFDYAWNKVINGMKRPTDALLKIDEVSSSTPPSKVLKLLKSLTDKKVGIPIKPSVQSSLNEVHQHDDSGQGGEYKLGFLAQVLKFGRNQPRAVAPQDDDDDDSVACGVNLSDGTVCRNPRVEGRKRCAEHKGKKKKMSNASSSNVLDLDSASNIDGEIFIPICGVILLDGSQCTKNPVTGRKRCEEHKGKRIQTLKLSYQASSTIVVDLEKPMIEKMNASCNVVDLDSSSKQIHCGVILLDGSPCLKNPVTGRKRCEEHKGKRIQTLKLSYEAFSTIDGDLEKPVMEKEGNWCGVIMSCGSKCLNEPVKGRKRCEDHKGMRIHYKVGRS